MTAPISQTMPRVKMNYYDGDIFSDSEGELDDYDD